MKVIGRWTSNNDGADPEWPRTGDIFWRPKRKGASMGGEIGSAGNEHEKVRGLYLTHSDSYYLFLFYTVRRIALDLLGTPNCLHI